MREPSNDVEWQEAVDAAEFWLTWESLKKHGFWESLIKHGFIKSDQDANIPRCESILEDGRKRGFSPTRLKDQITPSALPKQRGRGRPRKIRPDPC